MRARAARTLRNEPAVAVAASDHAPLVRDYRSHQSHERRVLVDALNRAGGNKSRAAQALGLTARQFAYRLQKLGADAPA